MKKNIIFFVLVLFALVAGFYITGTNPYSEKELSNDFSIEIRKYSDWEVSIPIFYIIKRKSYKIHESTPIYYGDPDSIIEKKIKFGINNYTDIGAFTICLEDEPDTIIGIGNYDKGFSYPDCLNNDCFKVISSTFEKIKLVTKKANLEIQDYRPPSLE